MIHEKGFSLVEVLVALMLSTLAILMLIEQQCCAQIVFNQILVRTANSQEQANQYESQLALNLKPSV